MDIMAMLGGYGGYLLTAMVGFYFGYKIRDKQLKPLTQHQAPRADPTIHMKQNNEGQWTRMTDDKGNPIDVQKFERPQNGFR